MNNKKIVKILAMTTALSMLLTTAVFAFPPGQIKKNIKNNIKNKNNYQISSNYMMKKGIIKGYGNGDFGFEDYVKRGDIAVMIVRAFKFSTSLENFKNIFSDVDADSYFYNAIAMVKYMGIAKGNGKNNFSPNKYVTVNEAILLIERAISVANDNVEIKDVNLYDIFQEDDLDKPATRQDIALMLYYAVSGTEYNGEADDCLIEYTVDSDSKVTFDEDDFIEAFKEIKDDTDKAPVYVRFQIPNEKYGKLYYDYDEDDSKKSLVTEQTDYYINNEEEKEISEITFLAGDYTGTVNIPFVIYDEDEGKYSGNVKILIKQDYINIKTINYKTQENELITFNDYDFRKVYNAVSDNEFDYMKFINLDEDISGDLYYDSDADGIFESDEIVKTDNHFDMGDIDRIYFKPDNNFTGNVNIDYKVYDEKDNLYLGNVKISVKEDYLIDNIDLETYNDEKITFDLEDKLSKIDELENIKFDNVKFTEIPDKDEGKLYSDYDDNLIVEDYKYDIEDLNELTFVPDTEYDGDVILEYIAVDGNYSYEGKIIISVEKD